MTRTGAESDATGSPTPESDRFTDALDRFKREGCLLLVTGAVDLAVRARASRKLLGSPTAYRDRVLAVADTAVGDPRTHLPGSLTADSDGVTVLDHRPRVANLVPDDVAQAIATALPATPAAPEDGQVRFALATLGPWLDDVSELVSFFDRLSRAVDRTDAIGALHVPRPADHDRVVELTEHVDARIELRAPGDALPEQRWYLPATDTTTPWVTM